ncbi:efflux RND transporter periplasmic adaptor subunit [Pedobacter sp. L105]|uniref:efflux RND transporter periplasmic adaptor subunit n=1 Tax=Pedobacter sp. L105 TaxID=1641871 RepID=UPI00131C889E|nr:efflux RND transporter periplasmic adaptor subunit [Pedobacter sp. L105]
MKKSTKNILLTVILIVAAVCIWVLFFHKRSKPIALVTEKPVYGNIAQSVTATGTIEPVDTVSVGTQVSGTISVLNADFNSKVKKGELLAQLDKSLLQAVVDQDKANLRTQKSSLAFNESTYRRQKLLYGVKAISRADYETALNNYNAASAGVANAEAALRSAVKNLSYADIFSPIDGVVLSRNISIGQTVAASFSTPTLFVLAKDITKMQVEAAVDEADIGTVHQGQRATFTVDAYMDDSFSGMVADVRLHPKVSSNVVTYATIIKAPNEDMKLKPGMTANIVVYTKEVKHVLLISSKALNFSPDSTLKKDYVIDTAVKRLPKTTVPKAKPGAVWVLSGNRLNEVQVLTGLDDNTHVQILEGLSADQQVVTSYPIPGETASSSSLFPKPPESNSKKK